MNKYNYDKLIIDPKSEKAKRCLDKIVYFADNPTLCLYYANNNDERHCGILQSIEVDGSSPFVIRADRPTSSTTCMAATLILKLEPKPEYVPFKNVDEFLTAQSHIVTRDLDGVHRYLNTHGIWLKENGSDSDIFCMVIEFQKDGVFIGHANVDLGFATAYTEFTSWNKLYQRYTFLDSSPCGKIDKEDMQ